MLVVIYTKILHHSFIPTIYENFKSVFLLIYFQWMMFKQMDITSKMQNIMLTENYYMEPYSFYMTIICNETATRKV